MSVIGNSAARFSAWIDDSYPAELDPELVLRRRIGKISNEYGEVVDALEGYTGENPRKGVFDTREHVMKELMDVAFAALGAWEHMDGNIGRSKEALEVHADFLLNRVNLGAEAGHMLRANVTAPDPDIESTSIGAAPITPPAPDDEQDRVISDWEYGL